MSKRNSDGDVLTNRLNLGLAKNQKILASWMGVAPESTATTNDTVEQVEDDDLKQNYGHDRLGVGSMLPMDIADGSFTRRTLTSNDKLLEQLLGKKKAKAHLAAKAEAARPNASAKAQRYGQPAVVKRDESDDEEEGRAATFKSKRSRKTTSKPVVTRVDSDDEDEEMRAKRLAADLNSEKEEVLLEQLTEESKEGEKDDDVEEVKTVPRKSKAKPKSFLDEILAERSKKQKAKSTKKEEKAVIAPEQPVKQLLVKAEKPKEEANTEAVEEVKPAPKKSKKSMGRVVFDK